MVNMAIWNKREGFNLADGTPCTVEDIYTRYPFTQTGTVALEYLPNGNVGGIDDLAILREIHQVDSTMTDAEALAAIIEIRNTAPEESIDPVAAKLDYLIMMI